MKPKHFKHISIPKDDNELYDIIRFFYYNKNVYDLFIYVKTLLCYNNTKENK